MNTSHPLSILIKEGLYDAPFMLAVIAFLHEQLFYAYAAQTCDADWQPGEIISAQKEAIMWRATYFGSDVMPYISSGIEHLMSQLPPLGLDWINQEQRLPFRAAIVERNVF